LGGVGIKAYPELQQPSLLLRGESCVFAWLVMNDRELFRRILGLQAPWQVVDVHLDDAKSMVTVCLARQAGLKLSCPECGGDMTGYDSVLRRWRHLDTCQYQTVLEALVPRGRCPEHGVRQVTVPWAEERNHFTRRFEWLAIDWLLEIGRSAVARRLGLSWDEADGIMQRAVRRGLARRSTEVVAFLGIDEKSFQKGHDYVTVVCDLSAARVLFVGEGRYTDSLNAFYQGLTPDQLAGIKAVAMDMWDPYVRATLRYVPDAHDKIVFDKFHIAKHLNEAVDKVRRAEHKKLSDQGDDRLKGTKYQWLKNPVNFTRKKWQEFEALRASKLRTARAWAMKETLMDMWGYSYPKVAQRLFEEWYAWAIRSRLRPMAKVARMLKQRLPNILTYFRHPITNAMSESLNAKIQWIKYTARGFRNRDSFRTAIYFYCGGLNLYPL
jgi:transposase